MASTALEILWVGLALLAIMFLGWLSGFLKLFHDNYMVPLHYLNIFVFYFGIPALVFKGLATKDFGQLDWVFVAAFLLLRVFSGLAILLVTLVTDRKIGSFLTHWIGSTWMNTVIFGIPILVAIYGPKVSILNILAAFSSLFFQLPFMLTLYEWRALRKEQKHQDGDDAAHQSSSDQAVELEMQPADSSADADAQDLKSSQPIQEGASSSKRDGSAAPIRPPKHWTPAWLKRMRTTHPWPYILLLILLRVLQNPPLIGILLGLLYSAIITTAIGVSAKDFPEVIDYFCTWLGNSVIPLAAFCVGSFMNGPFLRNVLRKWWIVLIYLVAKLLLLPLLAIPIFLMLGIDGVDARAGVMIASLPVALAAFSLSKQYDRGVEEMTSVISLGTLLMLPTALFWDWMMDVMDIWASTPNPYAPVPPPSCAPTPAPPPSNGTMTNDTMTAMAW
mmetsp:Transcript_35810/g.89843  ORF Transcript_35810/g.89843 Transcript_35810/m.89843 type:complete len:446 (+) Transcript_35810:75-1412(+)|eukprot:CAMPEP_0174232668 /NCGR_PEP_ID=MMETSP0417-20130205/2889_1 /TAXON_ID=242541 /ORGANISM="Mayorella sp, Strain BSH-02190019" /LENGTH=445 /DNA_ID=CAMNT_0015310755 /DNA_START=40 /DNA_END=1377 /DNA_ORIENTATION=+